MDKRFEIPGYQEALELGQKFRDSVKHVDGVQVLPSVRSFMRLPGFSREVVATVSINADMSDRPTRTAVYDRMFRFMGQWPEARLDFQIRDTSTPDLS